MEFNLATMWPVGNPGVIKSWAVLFGPCWNGAVKLSNNISLVSNNISLVFSTQHKAWLWGFGFVLHFSSSFRLWIPLKDCLMCIYLSLLSCHSSLGKEQVDVSGQMLLPRGGFHTLCPTPASLAGWDEFKLLVLHGSWASRTRVKYGMRLPGKPENPPPAWSTAQTSWALHFSGIKWTRRVENCVLLCCFGCKKNPQNHKTQQW